MKAAQPAGSDERVVMTLIWRCTCNAANFNHYSTCCLCGNPRPPSPSEKDKQKGKK